jgi:hypothetical protein
MASTDRRKWAGSDFVQLMSILSLDLLEAYEHSQTDPWHQATRRTWVRTFCSQLEAFAYATKQMVADLHGLPFVQLTDEDFAFLRETAMTRNGGAKKPRFLPLKDNLKHLALTTARAMAFKYEFDSGSDWTALLSAIAIRDRLVHPKKASDMIVTDDELKIVSKAQDWYHRFSQGLWAKIDSALKGTND